jgi:aspartyl/asparaginyl-tRNA synthetase
MTKLRKILNSYTGSKEVKHTGAGNSISVENILKQREATHGDFPIKATTIQVLKNIMRGTERWRDLSFAQQESLDMVMTKVGRILHGNPNELDHWLDIIGYTKLISDELQKKIQK